MIKGHIKVRLNDNLEASDMYCQMQTERGSICVSDIFTTKEKALENGYSYAFHSRELDGDCYSIIVGENRRIFAVVVDREMGISELALYKQLGDKDIVSYPKAKLEITSREAREHIGDYISYTSAAGNSYIFKVEKDLSLKRETYARGVRFEDKQHFHFIDKKTADTLKKTSAFER